MKFLLYILTLVAMCQPVVADQRNEKIAFLQRVNKVVFDQCYNGNMQRNGYTKLEDCRANHSPSKCAPLAYLEDLNPWMQCVSSCGIAGMWARNFGECS